MTPHQINLLCQKLWIFILICSTILNIMLMLATSEHEILINQSRKYIISILATQILGSYVIFINYT